MNKGIYLITILLFAALSSYGQNELIDQYKVAQRADLLREMDKGVNFMEAGEFQMADEKFRFILSSMNVIPANLAFYIGKNSFFMKNYKQSIDWLNKYIQLKGTKGQYYFESVTLLKSAEEAYVNSNQKKNQVIVKLDSLLNTNKIDCGPSGLVVCPVCQGKTLIIEKGKLGEIYRPCPYSDDSGFLTCEEYNLLLNGKLKPKF